MPIMSAHRHNDARGTARVLALAARDCIRNPDSAASHEVALNNAYRLLQAYRVNRFFGLEPRTRPFPPRAAEAISLLPRPERRVKDVRIALEDAVTVVFHGQSKEEAVNMLERVLKGIAYPDKFTPPSDSDREKAGKFFNHVLEHLNVG